MPGQPSSGETASTPTVRHDDDVTPTVTMVALLGFGVIGRVHARALNRQSAVTLGCVVDPDPRARDDARVEKHNTYADLAAMHGDVDRGLLAPPDMYVLATPTRTHLGLVARLLETTAALVMSEKPLTDDSAALDLLFHRTDADDRVRVVNHFAFSPEVDWAARLVAARGWGPPRLVMSVFNDPYIQKPVGQRATYVSAWTDSGPNQLGLLAHFLSGCAVVAHDAVDDGTRSTTMIEYEGGRGSLTSNWHTGDSSKQTTLRWSGGRELWLDHTAMTAVAVEKGAPFAHAGHPGAVDRKNAHYEAMYHAYFTEPAHPLLSLGFASELARLLRQASEAPALRAGIAWESASFSARTGDS